MATERELSEEALKAIVDGVTAKLRETLQRAQQGVGRVVNPVLRTRRRRATMATPELRWTRRSH